MKYLSLVLIDTILFWQNCFMKIQKFLSWICNYLKMYTKGTHTSSDHTVITYISCFALTVTANSNLENKVKIYIYKIFLYQIIFVTLNKPNPQMLCYMKKCPTIYIKIGTVHISTRAAFGFKSILQNKGKCHHMAALLALIHTHKNAFQF